MFYIFQTIVITLTFYSFTKNHYIEKQPLHSCLMAKICNHTGINMCGLEKDQRDMRLFLDDCDMFEYNCDNKKAYSKVDDKLCKEDITGSNTETSKASIIIIPTKPMTPVSGTTPAKCTCIDVQTLTVPSTESTITSTQIRHECTCTQSHSKSSSMKTAIDKTTEIISNNSETIAEKTVGSTYANVSGIPIASECTRGKKNSTSTAIDTVISAVTKRRCTCMDTEITTSLLHLETKMLTTRTYLETEESTTSPITKTQINPEIVRAATQIKRCTCNSVSLETSDIITTPTKPMTPVSGTMIKKCTCADMQTIPVPSTESTITSTQIKHECTCTHAHSKSSSMKTAIDIITHTSCDKYPKHCKRPHTWETTPRGETRDFFQILRERFGNRVKILRDTTHWPLRIPKPIERENDAFHFGALNEI